MKIRRALGAVIIPALVAGMVTFPASAQEAGEDISSIAVYPVGTTQADPNGGQWFVTDIEEGQTRRLQVRLYNPADVPQTVKLYLADMRFDDNGVPEVQNEAIDVGTWGAFERPTVSIAPKQNLIETFSITAPKGADPGDHVGAVVAEHQPQGTGNIQSIKRMAVRLYATLPGDARKEFEIDHVAVDKDSWFMTREMTVNVGLRNTGRVRLEPTVTVDGADAEGPELLMSTSVERYIVTRPVKFWGGPMRLRIDATTRSLGLAGPARQLRVTVWVIPWHLFAMLAMLAAIAFGVRFLLRRRGSKMDALRGDLRRLERLVAERPSSDEDGEAVAQRNDARAAIMSAIKQARRSGDLDTAERLEAALDQMLAAPKAGAKKQRTNAPPRRGGPAGGSKARPKTARSKR